MDNNFHQQLVDLAEQLTTKKLWNDLFTHFNIQFKKPKPNQFVFNCPFCLTKDSISMSTKRPEGKFPKWLCQTCDVHKYYFDSFLTLIKCFLEFQNKVYSSGQVLGLIQDFLLEQESPKQKKELPNYMITFGTNKGKYLHECRKSYVKWLVHGCAGCASQMPSEVVEGIRSFFNLPAPIQEQQIEF